MLKKNEEEGRRIRRMIEKTENKKQTKNKNKEVGRGERDILKKHYFLQTK